MRPISRIGAGGLLAVTLSGCAGGDSGAEPTDGGEPRTTEAVFRAWRELRDATLANKGTVAASRVTAATLDYYGEVRDLALYADRPALLDRALAWRLAILAMRLRMTADELEAMDGSALYAHAVDHGWTGKDSMTDQDITDIKVNGDHASAMATKAGQPIDVHFHFLREDGSWRLDMMRLMSFAYAAVDQTRERSRMSEDEYLDRMLEIMTGRKLRDTTWTPLRQRASAPQGVAPR